MSIIDRVLTAFPDLRAPDISDYYNTEIEGCKRIYQNNPPWKNTKKVGLTKKGDRERAMLNVAKVMCDKLAILTFSEQCDISISVPAIEEYVKNVLEDNRFWDKLPEFLSRAYALGGGVIKVYVEKGVVKLNYVNADRFLPTEWDNKHIVSGIFESTYIKGNEHYTLFECHSRGDNGKIIIDNKLFRSFSKEELGCEVRTEQPHSEIDGYDGAVFSYFKPAIGNNKIFDVPLGLSVFSNAIDTLKAIDIAFDSYTREFILGRKRIIVPASTVQAVYNPQTNQAEKYFDSDDEVYQALNCEDIENLKVQDNSTGLRVQEHVDAINSYLDILCMQCGLSAGALSFDHAEGLKTATEIVSEENDTSRVVKNNKNLLTEFFESIIETIIALGKGVNKVVGDDYEITIGWSDNIIIDDNTLIDNNIKLVQAGLRDPIAAIMAIDKCDEETARKEYEAIQEHSDMGASALDNRFGGDV